MSPFALYQKTKTGMGGGGGVVGRASEWIDVLSSLLTSAARAR